ncbi:MAG: ATP-binding protein [Microcoleus anatoxicus]|uniref:sensor histidine kinase n=1 Tax=Microcoleus anatoxicus TaxID=2705319 RepID=UPI00366BCA35
MTHYYRKHSFSSDFSDRESSQMGAEITPGKPPVNSWDHQLDRLLKTIPHIVWQANADGAVTYLNRAWEEYTGVAPTAALDFGYLESVHPEDRARFPWRSGQTVSLDSSYEIELRLRTRSGIYRWNLAKFSRVNGQSEGVLEWVGTYTDIDGFKQTQERQEAEPSSLKNLPDSKASETAENLNATSVAKDAQQHHLQVVERFTNLLHQPAGSLCELFQAIADAVVETIAEAQFCLVALPNCDDNHSLLLSAVTGAEKFAGGKTLYVQDALLSQAFATGKSQLSSQESGAEVPAAGAVAIESLPTGRLGVLAIGNWQDSQAIDDATMQLLGAIGRQAAIAIHSAQAIEIKQKQELLLDLQNQLLLRQQAELEKQSCLIQQQKLQLLEAAKLKSQFLRTMSHELRTPMNAIIGFSQLLLRQDKQLLTPQQRDFVGRIFNNGKNLLVLINDILDISKMETCGAKLEIAEFDLAQLVIATALECGNQVTDKNLSLSVSVCLQERLIVHDQSRLRQLLVNLISNSIKFTHQGNIGISVRELTLDRLIIKVTDTGIGISEADLPHIFDKFHQADRTTSRQYPGIGLGLAISASLAKTMNSTLTVESQVGKGSTFRIELPRKMN